MNGPGGWRVAALVVGGWLSVGLAASLRLHFSPGIGARAPLPFPLLLRLQLLNALPWAGIALIAIHLARRWPVTRDDILRPVTLHLAAALGAVPVLMLGTAALRRLAAPPGLYPASVLEGAAADLARYGPAALGLYLVLVGAALLWNAPASSGPAGRG